MMIASSTDMGVVGVCVETFHDGEDLEADAGQHGEHCQQYYCGYAVDVGESPCRHCAHVDYAYNEVLLDVALHGEQEVGREEHQQHRHEPAEQFAALPAVERHALRTCRHVGHGGLGKARQLPACEAEQREGGSPYQGGHPHFAHVERMECVQAERLGHA